METTSEHPHVTIGRNFRCPVRLEVLWAIKDMAREIHMYVLLGDSKNAVCQADRIVKAIEEAVAKAGEGSK